MISQTLDRMKSRATQTGRTVYKVAFVVASLMSLLCGSVVMAFASSSSSASVRYPSRTTTVSSSISLNLGLSRGGSDDDQGNSSARVVGDCAVVGVGVLGTSLCQQLLAASGEDDDAVSTVTGITKTKTRHDAIRDQVLAGQQLQTSDGVDRFRLMTADEHYGDESNTRQKFTNVVFCAPPSGFEDYPAAVQEALDEIWAGPQGGGSFVFTSSGGIYGPGNERGGTVNEASPIAADATTNPRIGRLKRAEDAVIAGGGCVLRLAGLYNLQRGAHNYWLTSDKDVIPGNAQGLINLLHYEDAAGACVAAIMAGPTVCQKQQVFLVSDSNPLTRQQICESSLKAAVYRDYRLPTFQESAATKPQGKIYDGSLTNRLLNWSPRYESFDTFMESHSSY